MAGSFNKVMLMGHLTRDPDLTYTPSRTPVVEISLATNRYWTDHAGEKRSETCFITCKAFGRQAENINKYFVKGKPIFIEGHLKFESWEDKTTSEKRSRHRVVIESFQFIPRDSTQNVSADVPGPDVDGPCKEL